MYSAFAGIVSRTVRLSSTVSAVDAICSLTLPFASGSTESCGTLATFYP